jgi:hypothetical protein
MVAKNIGFLIKNVPFAAKKAEDYFQSAIRQWNEIGSKGWMGRASLDLGRLHKVKGRNEEARRIYPISTRPEDITLLTPSSTCTAKLHIGFFSILLKVRNRRQTVLPVRHFNLVGKNHALHLIHIKVKLWLF